MVLFGLAVGCFFGVAYCLAWAGSVASGPRSLSLLVAGAGFLLLYLVPFLKYPANPPAVGNGDDHRAAGRALRGHGRGLRGVSEPGRCGWASGCPPGWARGPRRWSPGCAFAVAIGVVMAVLPPLGSLGANAGRPAPLLTETPQPLRDPAGTIVYPGFDADVLYWFRLYAVLAQAMLWGVIGVAFAPLAERLVERSGEPARVSAG